jgi:hypothetical protein
MSGVTLELQKYISELFRGQSTECGLKQPVLRNKFADRKSEFKQTEAN